MAAQQNNEMFKLSELFNVKDKGMGVLSFLSTVSNVYVRPFMANM